MPNAPRESFIPRKSNAPIRSRAKLSRQAIGLFGYVSYITFFGALILSAGVFFISFQVQSNLADRESDLDQVRGQFDQSQMDHVFNYERYLAVLNGVFAESFSIAEVFTSIEESVIESALLSSLTIEREDLENGSSLLTLEAEVNTTTFDAAMFQRSVYREFPLLQDLVLNDVILVEAGQPMALPPGLADEEDQASVVPDDSILAQLAELTGESGVVTFSMSFEVDPTTLAFDPQPLDDDTMQTGGLFFDTDDAEDDEGPTVEESAEEGLDFEDDAEIGNEI